MSKQMQYNIALILDYEYCNWNLGRCTIRHYLIEFLSKSWLRDSGFNNHTFGVKGWKWGLYSALVSGNFVSGVIDEDGFLESIDEAAADKIIMLCVDELQKNPIR